MRRTQIKIFDRTICAFARVEQSKGYRMVKSMLVTHVTWVMLEIKYVGNKIGLVTAGILNSKTCNILKIWKLNGNEATMKSEWKIF